MKIQFIGATQTVTGSRTLLSFAGKKILVDCGLFQGFKHLRLKNWDPFPVAPADLDAVLLTHAHLDHSGYLPLLVKNGFRGRIYASQPTRDLCGILLPDSGYLQEEEANYANKRGYSKHRPALPLYTEKDAERSLDFITSVDFEKPYRLFDDIDFQFELLPAGHLMGSSSILVTIAGRSIAFSGDIGRTNDPIMKPAMISRSAETLVIESTYGNRRHGLENPEEELKEIINRTFKRGGTVLIPSFAVGRAQLVLFYIHKLKEAGAIPDIPVYLNSPMAARANQVFLRHCQETRLSREMAEKVCRVARVVDSVEESIQLNERKDPMILIAASGMATGGRVLHHLKAFAPDEKNSIVFVGFQAGGTRGDALVHGAKEIKIHGDYWPVRAEVSQIESMSAHADGDELLNWIQSMDQKPKRVFINHGEPMAAETLRLRIQDELNISALTPEFGEVYDL